MARSRQLKPDFFQDEDIALLTHGARLLFQGLWLLADRRGRLEDRPMKLKAHLFPYEDMNVEAGLDELSWPKKHGHGSFIVRYVAADGRKYIQVCNFEKHQKCHPKEPDSTIPERAVATPEPAAALHGSSRQDTAEPLPAAVNPPCSYPSVPSLPSESSTKPSLPASSESERPSERSSGTVPSPANPFVGNRRRALESEALTLSEAVGAATGKHSDEVWRRVSEFKGQRVANPASMTDNRLLQTVYQLRDELARAKPDTPPPAVADSPATEAAGEAWARILAELEAKRIAPDLLRPLYGHRHEAGRLVVRVPSDNSLRTLLGHPKFADVVDRVSLEVQP